MLRALKEDAHSDVLLQKVVEDASMGRMSKARVLTDEDVRTLVLSPRFCVEQGQRLAIALLCVPKRGCAMEALTGRASRNLGPSTTSLGPSSMRQPGRRRSCIAIP